MNNNLKVVLGTLTGVIISGLTVVGANQAIQATQNTEIKVSLNGEVQTFKDETTGEVQYPITYHDRTYLPLRNVANLAGLDVDYDQSKNMAILRNNNLDINNSLSKEDMEEKLMQSIYGGEVVHEPASSLDGLSSKMFLVDINEDRTPEIIKFGNPLIEEDTFQVYTIMNDKVVTTIHEYCMLNNVFAIYETENGVYAYECNDDGPINDNRIVKLELNGSRLDFKEIIRHYIFSEQDYSGLAENSYFVDGIKVNEDEYNNKITELNRIKILNKNVFRKESDVKNVNYENLWN